MIQAIIDPCRAVVWLTLGSFAGAAWLLLVTGRPLSLLWFGP